MPFKFEIRLVAPVRERGLMPKGDSKAQAQAAQAFRPPLSVGISAFEFRARRSAFSLIEIMVTVGLLSFIILGLLLMFNQTQRAFRMGLTTTDVLESGRATMDLIARELEQMSPSEAPDYIDFTGVRRRATNFFVEPSTTSYKYNSPAPFSWVRPLVQELPGNALPRTNLIQRFFFLTKVNQDWMGTGYEVIPDDANQCVGTLYRFTTNNYPRGNLFPMSAQFLSAWLTNRSRIADGIVHMRLEAYAANGRLITTNYVTGTNASYQVRFGGPYTNVPNALAYSGAAYSSSADLHQASCYFMSNAVPAFLELELGLLEPQILRKYRSIPSQPAALQYLSNHVAQVHIFRQRIPVRNVDPSAYP
jgi:hypothetical protein